MFRSFPMLPVLMALTAAGIARAEDVSGAAPGPTADPAPVEQPAPPAAEQPAEQPKADESIEQRLQAVADERLPTAQRPGYWQLHPVKMPKVSMPKPEWSAWKPTSVYAGAGIFNDMVHLGVTALTGKGIFYARLGRFVDTNSGSAINAGWRKSITGTADSDGYTAGVFFGHVMGDSYNDEPYNRLGIGADMSRQWVNEHTMKVFSVGVGVGQEKEAVGKVAKKRAKPTAFFSYSVSLKLF